jgi:3-oxoacyl-[acyl-carrier protein] reductase
VGAAVAAAFAAEGANLCLVGRELAVVEERCATLAERGATALAFACDLTDLTTTDAVGRRVTSAMSGGRLEAVVHVAGGFAMSGPIEGADPSVLRRQIDINLTTAFIASRVFVPLVRDGGSVLYFASAAALPGGRSGQMAAYVAAKAGVIGLMQSVADELRPRRVCVNAVAPTAIATATNLAEPGSGARYVSLDAVAAAVLFLCAPASAVTGQVVRLSD